MSRSISLWRDDGSDGARIHVIPRHASAVVDVTMILPDRSPGRRRAYKVEHIRSVGPRKLDTLLRAWLTEGFREAA